MCCWNGPADKARAGAGREDHRGQRADLFAGRGCAKRFARQRATPSRFKLIVQADTYVHTAEIDYHDGERYPVLERVEGTPDYLDDITTPLTKPEEAPETHETVEP